MTTFIATLGFDSTRVTRPVLTHGLEEQDAIVLVHPTNHDNPRAQEARYDVRRMVTELQPNVDIEALNLEPSSFFDSIRQTAMAIAEAEDDVVLVLGGGARDIYLPVAFTVFIQRSEIDTILQFSDITGSVNEIAIPNFLNPPSDSVTATLEEIVAEENGISLSLIADTLGISKSTVARHVNELEEREYVESEMDGKSKIVFATDQGRLAVDIGAF